VQGEDKAEAEPDGDKERKRDKGEENDATIFTPRRKLLQYITVD
jgi:hypothetical protein